MTDSTSQAAGAPRPKAFLSYSWSSPEYIDRVEELARNLVGHGVEVIFDQWDLAEGQDVHAYMEQAVSDPSVTRVLLLCDPVYAEKADGRRGGVGKETLIISAEVYEHSQQTKFVPVVMEKDANGEVRLPTYLKGRYRIDLSDPSTEAEQYERLLRNLFNKPERQRPELGSPPAFLDDTTPKLRTARTSQTFQEAVLRERSYAPGLFRDYLDRLVEAYSREVILEPPPTPEELCDQELEILKRFLPYRDEFADLIVFLGQYGERLDLYDQLHAFFERLLSVRWGQRSTRYREELTSEHLGFICWEFWLYSVGGLLRAGRGEAAARLFAPYYVENWRGDGRLRSFDTIDTAFELLESRNPETRNRRRHYQNFAATLLRERATHTRIPFEALIEADVLGWFRSATEKKAWGHHWYPRTLIYRDFGEALPTFARAESAAFFARVAPALGVRDRVEFEQRYDAIPIDQLRSVGEFPGGNYYAKLMGLRSRAPKEGMV